MSDRIRCELFQALRPPPIDDFVPSSIIMHHQEHHIVLQTNFAVERYTLHELISLSTVFNLTSMRTVLILLCVHSI